MSPPAGRIERISIAPVKGLALVHPAEVRLGRDGVAEDRRFYVIDEAGTMVNGKRAAAFTLVRAECEGDELRLTLPDGEVVAGPVEPDEDVEVRFFGLRLPARVLRGPFAAALSEVAGRPLRLVEAAPGRPAVDRGHIGAATLLSRGSLAALARAAGVAEVDARRFRMLFEIDGVGEHEEDDWIGREVRAGAALLRVQGNVGRCVVTTRNPDTGEADFRALHHLEGYRPRVNVTERLPFGVHAEVLEPGVVRVGDTVGPAA